MLTEVCSQQIKFDSWYLVNIKCEDYVEHTDDDCIKCPKIVKNYVEFCHWF